MNVSRRVFLLFFFSLKFNDFFVHLREVKVEFFPSTCIFLKFAAPSEHNRKKWYVEIRKIGKVMAHRNELSVYFKTVRQTLKIVLEITFFNARDILERNERTDSKFHAYLK